MNKTFTDIPYDLKINFVRMKNLRLLIILVSAIGCKQIYDPVIDSKSEYLVITGILTNDTAKSRVIVSKSKPYTISDKQQFVSGAYVKIYDNDGIIYSHSETSTGVYKNPDLKAEKGKSYFLEVVSPEGDVYRSESQFLSEKVIVDTMYGEIYDKKITNVKLTGQYFEKEKKVIETYFDLSNSIPKTPPQCRFEIKATLVFISFGGISWSTKKIPSEITSFKNELNTNKLTKQPLCYFEIYGDDQKMSRVSFILYFIDRYDLNLSSHQYYNEIKKQSQYEGKIFDPIPLQIKGNITCVNDPAKIALGNFEVSNVEKFIFNCRIVTDSKFTITKKDSLKNYTEFGFSKTIFPDFLF